MTSKNEQQGPPVVVTEKALRRIERTLKTRLRAYFRPGEKIQLVVEEDEDFVHATMSMVLPDGSFQLDLEAALVAQDQNPIFLEGTTSRARLLGAIEFLSEQLEEYFRNQRRLRFHIDWRLYPFEASTVRFRGRERNPELEERASDLLGEEDEENPR